jgi:hypothetical protein
VSGFSAPTCCCLPDLPPVRRGGDAEQAITEMAMLPSALTATRVLLGWEQADMHTAFGLPRQRPFRGRCDGGDPAGDHWLWRHPFDLDTGRRAAAEGAVAVPRWGQPERVFPPDAMKERGLRSS